MNILILAVGTRNKIVQYFRKALEGSGAVIAADASELAPALYDADRYYIVPPMTAAGYIDQILEICDKERVSGVLSLIDPELGLLAENTERFHAVGTTVIGSSYALCEMSLDKMRMYRWLKEHGYKCARSWDDAEEFYRAVNTGEIRFPVFVKPVRGSASVNISVAEDQETVELFFSHEKGLMIQEYLHGQEIGADVYIDMISGEVVSIFTKNKLKMRAGETDKAVSFHDTALFALIERFVKDAGYRGPIDIDLFEIDGEYYFSEVNPRFGGGYPFAQECGCDFPALIVENLLGYANKKQIGSYAEKLFLMKYSEVYRCP